jgi:hypothetical protein
MSRRSMSDRITSALGKGIGLALAAGAALLVGSEIPSVKRYLHILGLAKRGEGGRAKPVESESSPAYAQGPRRSGRVEPGDGRARGASSAGENGGTTPWVHAEGGEKGGARPGARASAARGAQH